LSTRFDEAPEDFVDNEAIRLVYNQLGAWPAAKHIADGKLKLESGAIAETMK